jgi:hypothetical protein
MTTTITFRGELVEVEFTVETNSDGLSPEIAWNFADGRERDVTDDENEDIVEACWMAQTDAYLASTNRHEP